MQLKVVEGVVDLSEKVVKLVSSFYSVGVPHFHASCIYCTLIYTLLFPCSRCFTLIALTSGVISITKINSLTSLVSSTTRS